MILIERILFELRFAIVMMIKMIRKMIFFMMTIIMMILTGRIFFEPRFAILMMILMMTIICLL